MSRTPDRPFVNAPSDAVRALPALSAPEAIARRRETLHFDPSRPVPDETLKSILHLAALAPSEFNLQPWRFLVVRSARNRQRLKACAFGQIQIAEAPVVVIVLGYLTPWKGDLDAMVDHQERLGAVSNQTGHAMRVNARRALENDSDPALRATRSAMLAAASLMVAAESLGLASALVESFDSEKLRHEFGIPDDHSVCGLVALGLATAQKPFPGRFGLGHVCHEEHFGQPWTLGEV